MNSMHSFSGRLLPNDESYSASTVNIRTPSSFSFVVILRSLLDNTISSELVGEAIVTSDLLLITVPALSVKLQYAEDGLTAPVVLVKFAVITNVERSFACVDNMIIPYVVKAIDGLVPVKSIDGPVPVSPIDGLVPVKSIDIKPVTVTIATS